MGTAVFLLITIFWGVVGIIGPLVVTKGPNRGILQVMLILTAFTCWLFWLCCYMAQMNPLIGPKLSSHTLMVMAKAWGEEVKEM
ncbi:hypothetical protein HCN44_004538 [Aphidius gifuensis]|uniref:V-type proton ATPase subunit n=1 Tax=Aphidius gifuensis TaxID=684658 RepID=A0A834XY94_APHGI|nr:V-type proton ATPase subunit e [Aphidius gifuensis]KAF7995066.1 hypothetical protein HCN44_004538 [Aphidius gifuensis]